MENAYRDLLGKCVDLVKLHVRIEDSKLLESQGRGRSGESIDSIQTRAKNLLVEIEGGVSRLSSLPEPEKNYPILKVIRKYGLDETERLILYFFIGSHFIDLRNPNLDYIAGCLAGDDSSRRVEIIVKYLSPYSKMLGKGILIMERTPFSMYCLALNVYREIIKPILPESNKTNQEDEFKETEEESEEKEEKKDVTPKRAPLPRETYAALDEYVIGQNEAKTALSIAVHRHYHQLLIPTGKISPSNILMIGPTGVGKTYLVRTLASFLQVPVAFVSANEFSETGYVGRSVGDMVEELYKKAGGNRKKAEQGIIFIDEIDKLAEQSSDFDHHSNRDVSGRSVQEELLDLLESGGSRNVFFGKYLHHEMEFDTSRILFIAAGAFNGLDRIVKENRRWKAGIGFVSAKTSSASSENVGSSIGPADLESYGFIPELLGRFPVICSLAPLSENNLASIMVEPKNSILGEYQKYFRSFGMEVEFKEGALKKIAQIAAERGTGARGLRSVLEAVLQPYLFAVGDSGSQTIEKQVTIDEKMVEL